MNLYIKQHIFSWGDKFSIFDENGQVVDGGYITASTQANDQDFELTSRDRLHSDTYRKVDGVRFELHEKLDSANEASGETILDMTLRTVTDEIELYDQYGYPDDNYDKEDGVLAGKRILIGLSEQARTSLTKADTALQEITTIDTSADHTHSTETNCGGLKVTPKKDAQGKDVPGSVNIEIDDSITFIFDCGSATKNI